MLKRFNQKRIDPIRATSTLNVEYFIQSCFLIIEDETIKNPIKCIHIKVPPILMNEDQKLLTGLMLNIVERVITRKYDNTEILTILFLGR